jgi:addiction module HigA family antidote
MIASYRDKRTRDFAEGKRVKAFDGVHRKAELKLDQMDAATGIKDLHSAIHPGEHLAEQLDELGMSAAELARQLGVPPNRITAILHGRRAITGDTALRLGHFFGNSPQFWLNLQALYDLRTAARKVGGAIRSLPTLGSRRRRMAERQAQPA